MEAGVVAAVVASAHAHPGDGSPDIAASAARADDRSIILRTARIVRRAPGGGRTWPCAAGAIEPRDAMLSSGLRR